VEPFESLPDLDVAKK